MATARIASAPRASGRERGTCPTASRVKMIWASRKSAGPEREDREPRSGVVGGMGDRELVADGDADQREHDQRQRPRAPVSDDARALDGFGHLYPDRLGALEVAPPDRDGPCEGDRQREQAPKSNGSPVNAAPIVSTVSPSAMMKNSRSAR